MTQNNNQTEVLREGIDIQQYLTEGVEAIVKDALRATLRDPKESLFMARFAAASRSASERRTENAKAGLHVPSYLIASITSSCNLHCAGCYSGQTTRPKTVRRSASSRRSNGKASSGKPRSSESVLFSLPEASLFSGMTWLKPPGSSPVFFSRFLPTAPF